METDWGFAICSSSDVYRIDNMRIRGMFKQLPKQMQFLLIIILVLTGMWLFITPFYNIIMNTFNVTPLASVLIGAIIVFIGIRKWKLHPW